MSIFKILKEQGSFLIPYILVFGTLLILVLSIEKLELQLFFNQFHAPVLDVFFVWVTKLGEATIIALIILIALHKRISFGIYLLGAIITNSVVVQLLKRQVFNEFHRPVYYLKEQLYLVDGFKVHEHFSFPSGHTSAAFCIFFGASLLVKNKSGKLGLAVTAILTGYSRVYLSQHFVVDIVFGSAIGVAISLGLFLLYNPFKSRNNLLDIV